jgi:hypothetical protein
MTLGNSRSLCPLSRSGWLLTYTGRTAHRNDNVPEFATPANHHLIEPPSRGRIALAVHTTLNHESDTPVAADRRVVYESLPHVVVPLLRDALPLGFLDCWFSDIAGQGGPAAPTWCEAARRPWPQ